MDDDKATNNKEGADQTSIFYIKKENKQSYLFVDKKKIPQGVDTVEFFHKKLCGTHLAGLSTAIIEAGIQALPKDMKKEDQYNLLIQALEESQPQDSTEARLRIKETLLFSQAMEYMKKAEYYASLKEPFSDHWQAFYMKFALKLLRLHGDVVNDIEKYKRRGQQQLVVQHVSVSDNAQAVVVGSGQK